MASVSLPRLHSSKSAPCEPPVMNLRPPPQGTAPALTLLLLPGGGQELWCHEEPHELAVLLQGLHRSGAPGPVARASGSGHRVQRETLGQHPCPTPNPDPRARRAQDVGPGKVPEGEALRRLHGLGRGFLLCRDQQSPVYRWCCILLPARPSHVGRGRGHGWLSLLPWPPRVGATLEATGEQGSWAGQERGLDPPGPALCSVAHGSQGLPCLPSPKLLDRMPPPCMKAPSSKQARRGHSRGRRQEAAGGTHSSVSCSAPALPLVWTRTWGREVASEAQCGPPRVLLWGLAEGRVALGETWGQHGVCTCTTCPLVA